MLRPDTFALTALLALLTAIGPLSVDLYLPALPEIGRELLASTANVQLTISVYLVGFAVGQIVYGPLSDIHGRRPVLLAGLVIYGVATLLCAYAPSIEFLIAARAAQAIGACGAVVLARAVVRDLYSGARAGRELSIMATIMGLAPAVAPTIGGVLQAAFGWRACFLSLLAAGAIAIVLVWTLLPETLRKQPQARFAVADLFKNFGIMLHHHGFLAYLGLITASFAGLFAFISGSSFVLQEFFGLTPLQFAFAFGWAAVGAIAGTALAASIVMRAGIDRTIGLGAALLAAGAVTMVVASLAMPGAATGIVVPMMLYMVGFGLTMPPAFAGALHPFPHQAGTASSLAGFVQQSTAAIAGALVGHLLGATAWPLVNVIAVCGVATLAIWVATRGVRRRA